MLVRRKARVVFPEPDGPVMASVVPGATVTRSRATTGG
jgi:hypothetical protein